MTDKESIDHSYEGYLKRIRKLAKEAGSFEEFIRKIKSSTRWYHGDPILPEFRTWTTPTYADFYEENK